MESFEARRNKVSGLASYAALVTGLLFILLSAIAEDKHWGPLWLARFVLELGLLVGVVIGGTIIYEKFLRAETEKSVLDQVGALLDSRMGPKGFKFLAKPRSRFSGYYEWAKRNHPQEVFIAGRSVLHIIDKELRKQKPLDSADAAVVRRLRQGCSITILMLDPRSELTGIVDRPGRSKEENLRIVLPNFSHSLRICRAIWALLRDRPSTLHRDASLKVAFYDYLPYFSYQREDDTAFISFYLLPAESPKAVFEITDAETRDDFKRHFEEILTYSKAKVPCNVDRTLISCDGGTGEISFNETLFEELTAYLKGTLDSAVVAG